MSSLVRFGTWILPVVLILPAVSAFADAELDDELTLALAAKSHIEEGKVIYTVCATCHTPEGWGSPDGHYPQIAGQHAHFAFEFCRIAP